MGENNKLFLKNKKKEKDKKKEKLIIWGFSLEAPFLTKKKKEQK